MANICTMSIAFYTDAANREKLQPLYDCIMNSIENGNGDFKEILKSFKIENTMDAFGNFDHIHNIEGNSGYVWFYADVCCDWYPKHEFLDALTKCLGIGYASASDECNAGIFEIFGDEYGIFFDHNYSTDIWDGRLFVEGLARHEEGIEFFSTKEEVLSFLNTLNTEFRSDDLEEWDDYLCGENIGHIRFWERIESAK